MDLEQVNSKRGDFTRLILKTPFERFEATLWYGFKAAACDERDFADIITGVSKGARRNARERIELAQQLLAILNNEPVKAGKVTITCKKALEALKQALIERYKALGMNQRQMTIEEAEAYLKDWRNNKDAEEWIREQLQFLAEEQGIADDVGYYYSCSAYDFDDFCEEPTNIEYFIEENEIKEEVTPKQIEGTIARTRKILTGKPPKNSKLHWLILRIRRHHKRHRNEDYRLIFDCMDLFGLIDEAMKKDWDKYDSKQMNIAKTSYIKSIYNQAIKYEADFWLKEPY